MTLPTYRKIVLVALAALYVIVITGALVRLTGSGLGCSDWPRCSEERFIDVSTGHGAIEQLNRLFTGVVAASVILAVLGSLKLAQRRRRLTTLSLGLVGGVLAQVVIGGIVVLTGLNPWANMAHFLVSMVLLANGLVLFRSIGPTDGPTSSIPPQPFAVWLTGILGLAAVVTGTVVTASGPHAGDEDAVRFGFAIHSVAKVHGSSVLATIAAVAYMLWLTKGRDRLMELRVTKLLGLCLLQALIGYVQYLADVPAMLVAVHIAMAALVWLALVDVVWLSLSRMSRVVAPSGENPQPSLR